MSAGVSQDWSWVASGWESSLLFETLSYASKAALKTDRKLDEEEATEAVWDMGIVVG
jgi:hypothetical protein